MHQRKTYIKAEEGNFMGQQLEGTASAAKSIQRVGYTHDAMIDMLIANPAVQQGDLAKHFGYTQAWVSRVLNSDAFQARLADRKEELIDPTIAASVDEKLRALASKSLDVLLDKVSLTQTADLSLKALEVSAKALGYGARQNNVNMQNNFVVALPPQIDSAEDWVKKHKNVVADEVV